MILVKLAFVRLIMILMFISKGVEVATQTPCTSNKQQMHKTDAQISQDSFRPPLQERGKMTQENDVHRNHTYADSDIHVQCLFAYSEGVKLTKTQREIHKICLSKYELLQATCEKQDRQLQKLRQELKHFVNDKQCLETKIERLKSKYEQYRTTMRQNDELWKVNSHLKRSIQENSLMICYYLQKIKQMEEKQSKTEYTKAHFQKMYEQVSSRLAEQEHLLILYPIYRIQMGNFAGSYWHNRNQ